MIISEIIVEGYVPTFGKRGNKVVRKYRCTSGSRKGRIVAKSSTCTAPKNIKARQTMKKTRAVKGRSIAVKSNLSKKYKPASIRTRRINRSRKKGHGVSRRKKI